MELFEYSECLKLRRERESQNHRPLLGGSASPFIGEGDSLTREREFEHVLLSLVAHVVGYKMVVGAHNTVYVRRLWQVLPCLPGTANVGAYNTVCTLIRLEGCIVHVWHDLMAPSGRCAGYGRVWFLVWHLT